MEKYSVGFDAGTQSVKVVICNERMECVASASKPTTIYYPNPGWVEMDVDEYLRLTKACMKECAEQMRAKGLAVEGIQLKLPVPSSRVNCNSFLDFLTASHALTFTALKSDLLKVSKSTNSSNKGSTFTLEKSMTSSFSGAVSEVLLFDLEAFLSASSDFIVGKSNTSRMAWESVRSMTRRSMP